MHENDPNFYNGIESSHQFPITFSNTFCAFIFNEFFTSKAKMKGKICKQDKFSFTDDNDRRQGMIILSS
jgi:hypothetical protein